MELKFKQIDETHIDILNEKEEKIGHIFTPAGSGESNTNCIQICGFTEAFGYWGCGVFKRTKDIQLLFDDQKMVGKHIQDIGYGHDDVCLRCYMENCSCENKQENTSTNDYDETNVTEGGKVVRVSKNPFDVKREYNLKERIIKKKE